MKAALFVIEVLVPDATVVIVIFRPITMGDIVSNGIMAACAGTLRATPKLESAAVACGLPERCAGPAVACVPEAGMMDNIVFKEVI